MSNNGGTGREADETTSFVLQPPNRADAHPAPTQVVPSQTQPAQDGNSVDLDRERANFVDNTIRYESTLRFINGHVKTMLSAITGQ